MGILFAQAHMIEVAVFDLIRYSQGYGTRNTGICAWDSVIWIGYQNERNVLLYSVASLLADLTSKYESEEIELFHIEFVYDGATRELGCRVMNDTIRSQVIRESQLARSWRTRASTKH